MQDKVFANPEVIFAHAEIFSTAAVHANVASLQTFLGGSPDFGNRISSAADVNHAFACELYLKCLQVIEQGFFQKGHQLKTLFNQLTPASQTEIAQKYDTDTTYEPIAYPPALVKRRTFLELIDEANDAFTKIRYEFEVNVRIPYDLYWPVSFIRDRILVLRPDFAQLIKK